MNEERVHLARRPRREALPENHEYRDEGCEVSPTCLRCPLPVCRYDDRWVLFQVRASERRRRVAELSTEGWTREEIANLLGVSLRLVYRDLEALRRER